MNLNTRNTKVVVAFLLILLLEFIHHIADAQQATTTSVPTNPLLIHYFTCGTNSDINKPDHIGVFSEGMLRDLRSGKSTCKLIQIGPNVKLQMIALGWVNINPAYANGFLESLTVTNTQANYLSIDTRLFQNATLFINTMTLDAVELSRLVDPRTPETPTGLPSIDKIDQLLPPEPALAKRMLLILGAEEQIFHYSANVDWPRRQHFKSISIRNCKFQSNKDGEIGFMSEAVVVSEIWTDAFYFENNLMSTVKASGLVLTNPSITRYLSVINNDIRYDDSVCWTTTVPPNSPPAPPPASSSTNSGGPNWYFLCDNQILRPFDPEDEYYYYTTASEYQSSRSLVSFGAVNSNPMLATVNRSHITGTRVLHVPSTLDVFVENNKLTGTARFRSLRPIVFTDCEGLNNLIFKNNNLNVHVHRDGTLVGLLGSSSSFDSRGPDRTTTHTQCYGIAFWYYHYEEDRPGDESRTTIIRNKPPLNLTSVQFVGNMITFSGSSLFATAVNFNADIDFCGTASSFGFDDETRSLENNNNNNKLTTTTGGFLFENNVVTMNMQFPSTSAQAAILQGDWFQVSSIIIQNNRFVTLAASLDLTKPFGDESFSILDSGPGSGLGEMGVAYGVLLSFCTSHAEYLNTSNQRRSAYYRTRRVRQYPVPIIKILNNFVNSSMYATRRLLVEAGGFMISSSLSTNSTGTVLVRFVEVSNNEIFLAGRTTRATGFTFRVQGFVNGGSLQMSRNIVHAGGGNVTMLKPFFLDFEQYFAFLSDQLEIPRLITEFGRMSTSFATIGFLDSDVRNISITDNYFSASMQPFTPAASNVFLDFQPNLEFSSNTTFLNSLSLLPVFDMSFELLRNSMIVDDKYYKASSSTTTGTPPMLGVKSGSFTTQNVIMWCSPVRNVLGFPPTNSKYYNDDESSSNQINSAVFSIRYKIENNWARFAAGQHTPFIFVNATSTSLRLVNNFINVTQSGAAMFTPQYWVSERATKFLANVESGSAFYSASNSFLVDTLILEGNKFYVNHLVGALPKLGGIHLDLAGKVVLMTCGTAVDHEHETGAHSPGKCFAFQTTLIEDNDLKMNVTFVDPSKLLLSSSSSTASISSASSSDSSFSSFTIGLINATTASMPSTPNHGILIARNKVTVTVNETANAAPIVKSTSVNNDADTGLNMLTSALPGSTFLLQLIGEKTAINSNDVIDPIQIENNQIKCFTIMLEKYNPALTETLCSFLSSKKSSVNADVTPPLVVQYPTTTSVEPPSSSSMPKLFIINLRANAMNVNLYNSYNPSFNSTNFYLIPFMQNFHNWGTFHRSSTSFSPLQGVMYPFEIIVSSPAPNCNIFNIHNQTSSLLYYKTSINTTAITERYGIEALASDGNRNVCLPAIEQEFQKELEARENDQKNGKSDRTKTFEDPNKSSSDLDGKLIRRHFNLPSAVVANNAIQGLSLAASAIATSISPALSFSVAKQQAMVNFLRGAMDGDCRGIGPLEDGIPVSDSPTQLSLGDSELHLYAGAPLGNFIITAAIFIVFQLIGNVVLSWCSSKKNDVDTAENQQDFDVDEFGLRTKRVKSIGELIQDQVTVFAKCHLSVATFCCFSFLILPSLTSAFLVLAQPADITNRFSDSKPAPSIVDKILAAGFALILAIVGVLFVVWCLFIRHPRREEFKTGDGGNNKKNTSDDNQLIITKIWDIFFAASGEWRFQQMSKNATQALARKKKQQQEREEESTKNNKRRDWNSRDETLLRENTQNHDDAPDSFFTSIDRRVEERAEQRYFIAQVCIDPYVESAVWFSLVELGMQILLAIVVLLTQFVPAEASCITQGALMLVLFLIYITLCVLRRPHRIRFFQVFMPVSAFLQFLLILTTVIVVATNPIENPRDLGNSRNFQFLLGVMAIPLAFTSIGMMLCLIGSFLPIRNWIRKIQQERNENNNNTDSGNKEKRHNRRFEQEDIVNRSSVNRKQSSSSRRGPRDEDHYHHHFAVEMTSPSSSTRQRDRDRDRDRDRGSRNRNEKDRALDQLPSSSSSSFRRSSSDRNISLRGSNNNYGERRSSRDFNSSLNDDRSLDLLLSVDSPTHHHRHSRSSQQPQPLTRKSSSPGSFRKQSSNNGADGSFSRRDPSSSSPPSSPSKSESSRRREENSSRKSASSPSKRSPSPPPPAAADSSKRHHTNNNSSSSNQPTSSRDDIERGGRRRNSHHTSSNSPKNNSSAKFADI